MTVYEKLPAWLKVAIAAGILLIGPVMVLSLWIWGVHGGIAAFVSIPILNLATPIFAMAFMVHVHKRLSSAPTELVQARR